MKALRLLRFSLAASALALPVAAAELTHEPLACVPDSGRALLLAEVSGFTPVSVRVDFQALGATEEYYLEMKPSSQARYFAVLPRVSPETREIRYRVSARGEDGREKVVGPFVAPVGDCAAPQLTDAQRLFAENLVLGRGAGAETIAGFTCDGIVAEMTLSGDLGPSTCAASDRVGLSESTPVTPSSVSRGGLMRVVPNRADRRVVSRSRP
jgi:hypothetical protein